MSTGIGARIREIRQLRGISQQELAQTIGVKQPAISQLEKGGSKTSSYLTEIALKLGVSAFWLQTGTGPRELDSKSKASSRKVPLLSLNDVQFNGDEASTKRNEWVFCPLDHFGAKTFAVTIQDDSMQAECNGHSFHKGDCVFVDPDRSYQRGDFILVSKTDKRAAAVKQYIEQDEQSFLFTSNPTWQKQYYPLDDTITINGTVIAVVQKF